MIFLKSMQLQLLCFRFAGEMKTEDMILGSEELLGRKSTLNVTEEQENEAYEAWIWQVMGQTWNVEGLCNKMSEIGWLDQGALWEIMSLLYSLFLWWMKNSISLTHD